MDRLSLDIGKLRRMSHVELRGLAKSLHIKANQKTEKLRDAIMDHMADNDDVTADDVKEKEEENLEPTSEKDQKSADEEKLQTPSERKLRRRTYELTPNGEPKTSDTDEKETQNEGGAVENESQSVMSSPLKTPKMNVTSVITMCDRSVGRTPIAKRTYELRSTKGRDNGEQPAKSMIPRPMVKVSRKKLATPNFNKIHQAAFNKLENLNEYVTKKEKLMENYKSFALKTGNRKPITSRKPTTTQQNGNEGTVFKPSVLTTAKMNLDFGKMNPLPPRTPKAMPKTPLKPSSSLEASRDSRPTFNLKESLARKLRYQPYKGPLKPLTESVQTVDNAPCIGHWKSGSHMAQERRLKERTENRDILKGVRRNRRLDLQLKMRGVIG